MIIKYEGDIFLAPTDIIVQQCNCFCTMGAGLAKEIKDRFPEVYDTDRKTNRGDAEKLGTFNFTKVTSDANPKLKYICNLYGQYRYGSDKRHTSYDALAEGFAAINEGAKERAKPITLAVPYGIGCGLGGGHWLVVDGILKSVFSEKSNVTMLVCKLEE